MGRHAGKHSGKKTRIRPLPILFGIISLAVVVVLGVWWWGLRDSSDPIDADPQRAYAQVVDSRPCTDPEAGTTIEFQVAGETVRAPLDGCGFKVGQRLAVQYLNGQPQLVRLVGVTATPASSTGKRLLPIAILAIGFVAAVAAIALIREKRKGRRRISQTGGAGAITVAEMRAAVLADQQRSAPTDSRDAHSEVAAVGDFEAGSAPAEQSQTTAAAVQPDDSEHPDLFAPKTEHKPSQ